MSLAQAAEAGRISRSALAHWEAGRRTPPAGPLTDLLRGYGLPERPRARLLALADPSGARIMLADSSFGTPATLGELLRAMRTRRGLRQAEVGRRVGRSQAAVARWENGDDRPDPATVQSLLFALDAGGDEIAAVACLDPTRLPDRDVEARYHAVASAPHPFGETLWLGLQAELWWRASESTAFEPLLQAVVNNLADWYVFSHRPSEAARFIERALQLGHGPSEHVPQALAYAIVYSTLQTGAAIDPALRRLDAWEVRLRTPRAQASNRALRALLVAEFDETRALALGREAQRLAADDAVFQNFATVTVARVYLRHDRPEQALEVLEGFGGLNALTLRCLALARMGRTPPENWIASIRDDRATREVPMYRARYTEIERTLARRKRT